VSTAITSYSATTYRYRTWRVAWGTFFLLLGCCFLLDSMGMFRVTAALFWPLFVVSMGTGLLLRHARRLRVEEDRSEKLAVAEERVRIARDLHDIVAHGVSLMTIQIAAARRVGSTKPEAAQESLQAAEQTGRQTLSELEGMLAALRGADASIGEAAYGPAGGAGAEASRAPLPRVADIPALVESVRRTGREVRYSMLGEPPTLPASVELVLYRVVQEALSNSIRYAGSSPIDVQLIFSPAAIAVFVDDEGPDSLGGEGTTGGPGVGGGQGASSYGSGSGHGLMGMQERLAAIGGTLQAGPRRPGPGWRVHASIPAVLFGAGQPYGDGTAATG
jgi:signal transduction histidine kinase